MCGLNAGRLWPHMKKWILLISTCMILRIFNVRKLTPFILVSTFKFMNHIHVEKNRRTETLIFILIPGVKLWHFPIICPCSYLQFEDTLIRKWWVQVIIHITNIGINWHNSSIGRLVVTASDISWSSVTHTRIPAKRKRLWFVPQFYSIFKIFHPLVEFVEQTIMYNV